MSKKRASANNNNNNNTQTKSTKQYDVHLPCGLKNEDIKIGLTNAFSEKVDYLQDNTVELCNTPFPFCVLKNFISDDQYVHDLKEELLKLKFHEKENDLFQFHQTVDLGKSSSKRISTLRELLFTKFRKWLEAVMEVTLEDVVDLSCSRYDYTDVLLCHDDQLEGRRIAFIYYLVPPDWSENDGGCLDLFNTDENGQPKDVVHSVVPSYNSLLFFEVSQKSFHQVAEVLTSTKSRVAISGWFHGERPVEKLPPTITCESQSHTQSPSPQEDEILLEWINPTYLNAEIVSDISDQFEENSEIQLKDFLKEKKYLAILKELSNACWKNKGPANRRCYYCISKDTPTNIKEFTSLLTSEPFFKLLTKLTGLQLSSLDEEEENKEGNSSQDAVMNPTCCYEVRKWVPGCYTLLHDEETCGKDYTLDAFIHFTDVEDWDADVSGGSINYLVKENGQELLSVSPMSNCLSLVYRDSDTWRFLKYINNRAKDQVMYDVCAMYMEGENTN